jgi:iron complex outermembrane receptor protein
MNKYRGSLRLAMAVYAALGAVNSSAQSQPAQAGNTATLPAVEVVGRQQGGAYHADEASGTKTELPLREVPQAVRVLSRQTLDDLGAVRLDDALDYVGGVSRQNSFGGLWDNIAIRGLAGDINNGMSLLRNGLSGNRGFNAQRDMANVERVEFLKGPAASLYGASEPGGTLNIVTKRPLWRSAHSVEGYVGSFDFLRATIDSTGPITENFAYRLNVALEDRGGFRDFVDTERSLFAPAFTWKISSATRLDYNGEWLSHKTPLDRGVVAINNQLGAVPRERFLGEPADGKVTLENQTHQFVLEHDLNQTWTGRLALSYKSGALQGYSTEAQPTLQADQQTLRRQRRYRDYASEDVTLQGEVVGRFRAGGVEHELTLGAETYRFQFDQLMLRVNPTGGSPYAINVFNPVYGQPQPVPGPNTQTQEDQRNLAFYMQDVIKLGESWRLLAGLRHDSYDQQLMNLRTGVLTRQSPDATTPRVGLSYLPSNQWTVFGNAGKSFRPNVGTNAAGGAFDPESGNAIEGGMKWENTRRTLGATFALFDIRKKNVLTADPANPGFSIAAGDVRSRGFDADLSGQLGRSWRINASFTYNDAYVDQDNTLELGGRLLNIPKVNGSLLLVYEGAAAEGRFGVGGGVTYTGDRLGEARTQAQAVAGIPEFELPAYTLVKAVAYWRASSKLRFSLDIDNLFDKTYYTQSFQRTWVAPGSPRTITLGMQTKF